jgi:hypothetical protein
MYLLEVKDGVLVVPKHRPGMVDVLEGYKCLELSVVSAPMHHPTIPRGERSAFAVWSFIFSLRIAS